LRRLVSLATRKRRWSLDELSNSTIEDRRSSATIALEVAFHVGERYASNLSRSANMVRTRSWHRKVAALLTATQTSRADFVKVCPLPTKTPTDTDYSRRLVTRALLFFPEGHFWGMGQFPECYVDPINGSFRRGGSGLATPFSFHFF
jgi:hypothetical protein